MAGQEFQCVAAADDADMHGVAGESPSADLDEFCAIRGGQAFAELQFARRASQGLPHPALRVEGIEQ